MRRLVLKDNAFAACAEVMGQPRTTYGHRPQLGCNKAGTPPHPALMYEATIDD